MATKPALSGRLDGLMQVFRSEGAPRPILRSAQIARLAGPQVICYRARGKG